MPDAPYIGYVVSHDNTYGWQAMAIRHNAFDKQLYPFTGEGAKAAKDEAHKRQHADYQINPDDLLAEQRDRDEERRHGYDL